MRVVFLFMNFLEKNLEQIIYETSNDKLESRGLDINGIKRRQQSIGNYGISDLITIERDCYQDKLQITVYELKKDQINMGTFLQGIRYCQGISNYISKHKEWIVCDIHLTLIGSSFESNSGFIYLPNVISNRYFNLNLYTYQYDFDGIKFKKESGYKLINEGF